MKPAKTWHMSANKIDDAEVPAMFCFELNSKLLYTPKTLELPHQWHLEHIAAGQSQAPFLGNLRQHLNDQEAGMKYERYPQITWQCV